MLFPAGIGMALSLAGDLTLYAVLPAYAAALAIGLPAVGALLSANRLVRLVSNSVVGTLSSRFHRRSLILFGLFTGLLSTLLYVTARSFTVFLLGRLLWGISWSIIYISVFLIMMDTLPDEDRGWGSGLLQTFYFIGLAVMPLIGGILSTWLGFVPALLACAGIQFAGLVLVFVFLPETCPPVPRNAPPGGLRAGLARLAARRKNFSLSQALKRSDLLTANYLYMLVLFAGDGIIMSTITLYLMQRYGGRVVLGPVVLPVAGVGGALLALRAVVSAGAAPLVGRWFDRSGKRWPMAALGALLAAAGCALLAWSGNFALVLAGVALTAFGIAVAVTVVPAIVTIGSGQRGGLYLGMLNTAGDFGCAVAPLVGYLLLGSLSLPHLYLVTGGLLLTGASAAALAARYDSLLSSA